MDRYEGKPFLRLLEWYVLDAIGQLHEHQRQSLHSMEPKLAKTFGVSGTWQEIVSAQMDFPASLPAEIEEIWERNLAAAHARGQPVIPEEFARAFIDQNFPDIVSDE